MEGDDDLTEPSITGPACEGCGGPEFLISVCVSGKPRQTLCAECLPGSAVLGKGGKVRPKDPDAGAWWNEAA